MSNFTGVPQDWQCVSCNPPFRFIASSLLARRHLGHAIIRYPALSLGTKSGAISLFLLSERIGEATRSFATSPQRLLESVVSFLKESVRHNPGWISADDVIRAHSDGCDVRKSLSYYSQKFKS